MKFRSLIAMVVFTAASFAASAQTLHRDNARIRRGVRSGELTRTERAGLKMKEARVRRDERAARANGVVTPAERRNINRDKKNLNRSIYRQKHDAQVRP